jgi:uncharacterized protein YecE (DUF72 family)
MIHVGTSGWSYAHWDGVLYPPGLPPRRRLEYYLARYRTVELNASYYRWPADSAFASWRRRLPDGFVMERQGREAFVYFNNDGGGNAVRNADRLRELLAE